MIFSYRSNIREDDQLLSRLCGYCYTANKIPIVICEESVWRDVSKYQEVIIELSKRATSVHRNDRIITNEELNMIIQDIDEHKRKPYMFENINMNKYGTLFDDKNKLKKKDKINMLMKIIRENDCNSLVEFINNSNCKQITMPKTEASYKKHVEDVYKKYQENRNFVIDFTPAEKNNDCWMGIIDNKNNRVFIIVWVVNSTVI